MASNNFSEDFDDFFDTSEPTVSKHEQAGKGEPNPNRSRKAPSVSSDHEASRSSDYSSDASSYSDSDSRDPNRRQGRRRSRSSSSRSEDSFSSDDSRSRSRRQSGKRRSRSRSTSLNRNRSRNDSDGSGSEEDKATEIVVKVSQRRDSNSSGASHDSCARIDLRQRDDHGTNHGSRDTVHNQAWSKDNASRKRDRDRTETKKQYTSNDRQSRRSDKYRHSDRKHSLHHSDSDITDVSPFSSPRSGCERGAESKLESKPPKCVARAPGVRAGSGRDHKDGDNHDALELNLLMKAVLELEKQKRVHSSTRRVLYESGRSRLDQKSNYSFSDHDIQRIEQENQRLLRQIMCRMHAMDGKGPGTREKGRQSTSAASGINRRKDHIRIEKENMALLKRLQQIKPSRGLSRQEQLSAYNSTLMHGVPIPTMHPTMDTTSHKGSGKSSRASSEAGSLARTRSLTSVQSATTTASSVKSGHSRRSIRSRPSSAKMSVRERPPWDDRW